MKTQSAVGIVGCALIFAFRCDDLANFGINIKIVW